MDNQTVGIWFWGNHANGKLRAGSNARKVQYFALNALPESMAFPTDLLVCRQLKHCAESGGLQAWLNSCPARQVNLYNLARKNNKIATIEKGGNL
jgi:hypothetical protein